MLLFREFDILRSGLEDGPVVDFLICQLPEADLNAFQFSLIRYALRRQIRAALLVIAAPRAHATSFNLYSSEAVAYHAYLTIDCISAFHCSGMRCLHLTQRRRAI